MADNSGDCVTRTPRRNVCDDWRVIDQRDPSLFRRYRDKYPSDGYVKGETDPFAPAANRKPPPLRGQ